MVSNCRRTQRFVLNGRVPTTSPTINEGFENNSMILNVEVMRMIICLIHFTVLDQSSPIFGVKHAFGSTSLFDTHSSLITSSPPSLTSAPLLSTPFQSSLLGTPPVLTESSQFGSSLARTVSQPILSQAAFLDNSSKQNLPRTAVVSSFYVPNTSPANNTCSLTYGNTSEVLGSSGFNTTPQINLLGDARKVSNSNLSETVMINTSSHVGTSGTLQTGVNFEHLQ